MTETKIEVENLFMRYREHNGNNSGGIKELSSTRAIIVLNNGAEQEIRVPKNENCDALVSGINIEVLSLLYTESRRI